MSLFTASTHRRIIAQFLDGMITGLFYLPVLLIGMVSLDETGVFMVPWKIVFLAIILEYLFCVSFYYLTNATLGKLALGLRLVNIDPLKSEVNLKLSQCLLRVAADKLAIFFSYAPKAFAFLRLDRTHISDWIAETRVVQFSPRLRPAKRRIFLFLLLVVLGFSEGFNSAYRFANYFTYDPVNLVLEGFVGAE